MNVWDQTRDEVESYTEDEATNQIRSLSFCRDGSKLAMGTEIGTVSVYNTRLKRITKSFKETMRPVSALIFSPDSKTLAAAAGGHFKGADTPIRLWNVDTEELIASLRGHTSLVFSLSFTPDGTMLASASRDRTVRVWDIAKRKEVHRFDCWVTQAAFSPDGKSLAWGTRDGMVHFWDIASKKERLRFRVREMSVESLGFTPDSKTLATCSDRAIRLWSTETGAEVRPYSLSGSRLLSLAFSPDGKRLAARGGDGTVCVWELPGGRELARTERVHDDGGYEQGIFTRTRSVVFPADGKDVIALACLRNDVHLFDPASGKKRDTLHVPGHGWFQALAAHPSAPLFAASNLTGIYLWSAATGKRLRLIEYGSDGIHVPGERPRSAQVRALVFTPDGRTLVSGGSDGKLWLWDWARGTRLRQFDGPSTDAHCLAVSADGKLVVTCGEGRRSLRFERIIRIWELASGTLVREINPPTGPVVCVDVSPDGRLLASASEGDKAVRVWDLWTGKPLAVFEGHTGLAWCVAFAPDGRALGSGSDDSTVLLWDVASIRAELPKGKPDARRLAAAWAALDRQKAAEAYPALLLLAGAGDAAAGLLARHLRAEPAAKGGEVGKLIAALDDEDFEVRGQSAAKLAALGWQAEPQLRRALAGKPSAEARKRLQELLAKLKPWPTGPEGLRQSRGVQVLELIGTARARAVLKDLAGGAPAALLTQDAKGALRRLEAQAKNKASPR
jgi:WD40 repeat protein